ncbi:MAG: hypothetical protein ACRCZ3_03260 [Providencia rustigianii]|uniref:hypothetical protein n=1 Tax=Providencia rustigianii TaxID=158850 RepID=UPI003F3378FF
MSIGIFWFVDNEIIGFKSNLSLLNVDSIGMIDSDFQHVRDWARLNVGMVEYEHFPRGRVVFDTNIKKHIVYLDEKLNTLFIRGKICDFFDIRNGENVIFKKDSHYVS